MKYESAHDWLMQKVNSCNDVGELKGLISPLIQYLDPDDIQEVFQDDMEQDGFFD